MNNDYKTTIEINLGYELNPEKPISSYSETLSKAMCAKPHRHPRAQVIYCDKGIMKVVTSGQLWIVSPLQGIWIPCQAEHQVFFPEKTHLNTLFIDPSVANTLPSDCFAFDIEPFFKSLLLKIVPFKNAHPLTAQQERLLYVFIDELKHIVPSLAFLPLSDEPRLKKIINEIDKDIIGEFSMEHYANIACISSRTLSRLFLKEFGITFSDWRIRLKLLEAIKCLEEQQSIKEIALNLGYENPSSFIHTFKKYFGKTPGEYIIYK